MELYSTNKLATESRYHVNISTASTFKLIPDKVQQSNMNSKQSKLWTHIQQSFMHLFFAEAKTVMGSLLTNAMFFCIPANKQTNKPNWTNNLLGRDNNQRSLSLHCTLFGVGLILESVNTIIGCQLTDIEWRYAYLEVYSTSSSLLDESHVFDLSNHHDLFFTQTFSLFIQCHLASRALALSNHPRSVKWQQ